MRKEDFYIGLEFYMGVGKWRCTDIGTRVVVAIRIDQVEVCTSDGKGDVPTEIVTDDPSWFNGPPYAVEECVIDEYDVSACHLDAG
ncbi:MAG: hypothetical protein ACRD9R_13400 [Pyrinomonadaceae bacterium]